MYLCNSSILPYAIRPPIDVKEEECESQSILIGHLVLPGLVLLRPCNFTIVEEFGLVSLLEITLEDLLLGLQGEILMIPSPIVEVVVVKFDSS